VKPAITEVLGQERRGVPFGSILKDDKKKEQAPCASVPFNSATT
jgi:hypothetical protein